MDNRSEKVLYLKESSIRWLTVNHPEKRNALSADVRVLALEKLRELEREKRIYPNNRNDSRFLLRRWSCFSCLL